eukprot:676444-Hanusia_phi.AAC.3
MFLGPASECRPGPALGAPPGGAALTRWARCERLSQPRADSGQVRAGNRARNASRSPGGGGQQFL